MLSNQSLVDFVRSVWHDYLCLACNQFRVRLSILSIRYCCCTTQALSDIVRGYKSTSAILRQICLGMAHVCSCKLLSDDGRECVVRVQHLQDSEPHVAEIV